MRISVARIHLRPRFASLSCLYEIAGDNQIVGSVDGESFAVASMSSQFIGLPRTLYRTALFTEVGVHSPEPHMRHGKLRIEFDGMLEQGNGGSTSACIKCFGRLTEGLKCLE